MTTFRRLAAGVLLLFFSRESALGDGLGELVELREEVREPDKPREKKKEKNKDKDKEDDDCHEEPEPDCCDDDSAETDLWLTVAMALLAAAASPVWVPLVLTGDDYDIRGHFPSHPYADAAPGYMLIGRDEATPVWPWSSRLRAEYADDLDGLLRIGAHGLFETQSRFGVEAGVNYWAERRTDAQSDSLWSGDANILYRFAQSSRLLFRAGAGINWLADDFRADFGWNVTWQADWFAAPPWVVSAELDAGSLGSAFLFHARSTAGFCVRNVELFAGIDYFQVGAADLTGLLCGLRIWN